MRVAYAHHLLDWQFTLRALRVVIRRPHLCNDNGNMVGRILGVNGLRHVGPAHFLNSLREMTQEEEITKVVVTGRPIRTQYSGVGHRSTVNPGDR